MTESIYRQLARRLDAVPNGFPATESGVEIRLLARLFTPEQARLAAVMRLTPEPSAEIAARAGVPAEEAHRALKGMARLGLIRTETEGRALAFGLLPFVVGFWEAQRPRLDRDLAELMEDYLAETRAGPMAAAPGLQRVIPVGRAIHTDVSVFPYERAEALVEGARSWAVGPCICRVQRRLVGQACDAPEEACLWFAPVPNAFRGDGDVRVIRDAAGIAGRCAGIVAPDIAPVYPREPGARAEIGREPGHGAEIDIEIFGLDRDILGGLRLEARAGHGQGKPVVKQADELADSLGFLAWQIGLEVAPATGWSGAPTPP